LKKIFGYFGIILILIFSIFAISAVGMEVEEENFNDLEIKWKILLVIGRVNICFDDKIISGFALIGYVAGEILTFEDLNIKYEGIPLIYNNGLFSTFLLYKPADNYIF
jgi:hypothetical protein